MPRRCDLWRVGIVQAPVAAIAKDGMTSATAIRWLPAGPSFAFDADPFGLWRDGRLHLFVEQYDYRTRHGVIDHILLDDGFRPLARQTVLKEPWHLSYPQVFAHDGRVYMLPEAYRSGGLTLYQADNFPTGWRPICPILPGVAAIDATPFLHQGRWWLFYSAGNDRLHRMGSLHAAWADALEGPWRPVPGPIRLDLSGARPGGAVFLLDGEPVLPVQDCRRSYGAAIRLLHLERLSPDGIVVRAGRRIAPDPGWAPFDEGLHTLSGCGPVTLIDAKRVDRTGRGWLIDAARLMRRGAARRPGP